MRILIAEDERDLNHILTERLRKEHYSVDACFDGQEALDYLEGAEYDALILDIMMPVMDGLTLLKKIRSRGNSIPVLLLTAKDSVEDRVKGLDAGANDYLVKPFAFEELLARIRAISRRGPRYTEDILQFEDLALDRGGMELSCGKNSIRLGKKEFELMELFLRNPCQVLPKELLLSRVWGLDSAADYNNVEVYISFLRQKLHALGSAVSIRTIRMAGYRLEGRS